MTTSLRPGDVVTCTSCGAQALATWPSQERPWQEGWPLALAWTHGPHPRTEVTRVVPAECLWCHELHQAVPGAAPLYLPPARAGGDPQAAPAPTSPPLAAAEHLEVPSSSPPAPPAAPAEFLELARAYRAATGRWPYAYPLDQVLPGESIDREVGPWVAWLRARNAAVAPPRSPAKPKKGTQLGLFGGGRA